MAIRYRPQWSSAFTIGLGVLAALPMFDAPFPVFALGTALGTPLYLVALFALGIGYFVTDARERGRDAEEQKARDAAAEARHKESIAKHEALEKVFLYRFAELETSVMSLQPLYQQRNIALKGSVSAVARVKGATLTSSTGPVSGTAGTGELQAEGFAPTISVEAFEKLDQEIREKESAVVKQFRLIADEILRNHAALAQRVAESIQADAIRRMSPLFDSLRKTKPSESDNEEPPSGESA